MKRITAFFISLSMLFILTACQASKNPDKKTINTATIAIGETHTDFEGVNIKLNNAVWDENRIKLGVDWINGTKHEVIYGEMYSVELERDGEWISRLKVNNPVFNTLGYKLKSGETAEKIYNLTDFFDITEDGKYRLITDCSVYDKGEGGECKKCNLWAEFTVTRQGDTGGEASKTYIDFEAQYIRTGSLSGTTDYPLFAVLRSADELNAYYESNKHKFNLERRKNPASDNTIGFLDACDKYDAAFFKKNALLLIVTEEGSGSTRHAVDNVKVDADGKCHVNIRSITPEVGTCDMAQWHIVIEIAKEHCPKSSDNIAIYKDDKLITDEAFHTHQPAESAQTVSDPFIGDCGNTQTTLYFDENKSYTFTAENSVTITDILLNLDYDTKKLCKCLPEYTVDTEFGTGYGINITKGYARCDKGQADLTQEQTDELKEIILWATDKAE